MDTPICDFVNDYIATGASRLHMPGHKGRGMLGCEPHDITEIPGADVLYDAHGIIARSEQNAASLFGTGATLYSTEGSSLCIRAMLYLAALHARSIGKQPRIAAGRNAHKTFVTAAALLDLDLLWLYPDGAGLLTCAITPDALERAFADEAAPTAVYITCPDYLGNTVDIAALSAVCHRHGALLLVDNAHGAYLHFLPESRHPIALGADLCCDSAHKTLPVLTGGAYLHIARTAPPLCAEQAQTALSLFASTSPSYLILQSLDAANRYLSDGYTERLCAYICAADALKSRLRDAGYTPTGDEPLKVTVMPKSYGYAGDELAAILAEAGLICEFSDPDHTVLMLTPECGTDVLTQTEQVLTELPRRTPIDQAPPAVLRLRVAMTARNALLLPSEEIAVADSIDRVLAAPTVSCPPAIPIAVSGEVIDADAVHLFNYYGITTCRVVC